MPSSGKNSTLFYHDWLPTFEKMTNEDVGIVTKALLQMDSTNVVPDLSDHPLADLVFTVYSAFVKKNREAYNQTCERRSLAAQEREDAKRHNCGSESTKSTIVVDKDKEKEKDKVKDKDKVKVAKAVKSKNKFNNFDQREYTEEEMREIENQLFS